MLGYFVALAVVVWIAQTVLGLRQFKKFNAHLKELRKLGRVAIGRARGGFAAGILVLFVIDPYCRIIKGEIMEGRTVFTGFKSFDDFNGVTLFELSEDLCKSMKLNARQTAAVVSARHDYENYLKIQDEEAVAG